MRFTAKTSRPRRTATALALPGAVLGALLSLGLFSTPGRAGEAPPLAQRGAKLTGAEEVGAGLVGHSVALSADGETALVGGPDDGGNTGAAWPFARVGETFAGQGGKLTGVGEIGEGRFGDAVALSADGDTALVGAPNHDSGAGAVWVYVRSGSIWTAQDALVATEAAGDAWFGRSVALSADGNTALVGGFVDHDDVGAAWVFTRSGSTWKLQGPKLTGGEESGAAEFGWSVALSGDGDTALVGGRHDREGAGAAWVFTRSGSTWTQQGPKLTGGEESGAGGFGWSTALSLDGDTALIGGQRDAEGAGAAWAFARSGATWAQQGPKLTGAGEEGAGLFGHSVALASDGSSALVGAPRDKQNRGAAWVFARSGSTWAQQGTKLTAEDEQGKSELGWSVALAASGESALIGGVADAQRAGAAWVFGQPLPGPQPVTTPPGSGQGAQAGATPLPSGPTPQHGVAGFKAVHGAIALIGRRLPVRGARAVVRLRCLVAATCRGRLMLALRAHPRPARGARLVTIARLGFSISARHAATVRLRLGTRVRLLLRGGRPLSAVLAIDLLAPQAPAAHSYAVKLVPRRATQ